MRALPHHEFFVLLFRVPIDDVLQEHAIRRHNGPLAHPEPLLRRVPHPQAQGEPRRPECLLQRLLLPLAGDSDVSEDHLGDVAVVDVSEAPRAPIHLHAHVPPRLTLGRALRTPARARRVPEAAPAARTGRDFFLPMPDSGGVPNHLGGDLDAGVELGAGVRVFEKISRCLSDWRWEQTVETSHEWQRPGDEAALGRLVVARSRSWCFRKKKAGELMEICRFLKLLA
nr:unnamed protein product [Digitaria exilis]